MYTEWCKYGYFFFFYTYPVFPKISPMNILFLYLEKGIFSRPFFKNKKAAWGIYVIEEQGDEVTRSYRKAHVCTLTYSLKGNNKAKKKKIRENCQCLAILVGWKGSWITENTCFLSIALKSYWLPILTKNVFVSGGRIICCIRNNLIS